MYCINAFIFWINAAAYLFGRKATKYFQQGIYVLRGGHTFLSCGIECLYDIRACTITRYHITVVKLWRFFIDHFYYSIIHLYKAGCRQAHDIEIRIAAPNP